MSSEWVSTWAELREKKVKRGDREADSNEGVAKHRVEEGVGNKASSAAARMNMSAESWGLSHSHIAGFLNENEVGHISAVSGFISVCTEIH